MLKGWFWFDREWNADDAAEENFTGRGKNSAFILIIYLAFKSDNRYA
jgi:hypothetical protein